MLLHFPPMPREANGTIPGVTSLVAALADDRGTVFTTSSAVPPRLRLLPGLARRRRMGLFEAAWLLPGMLLLPPERLVQFQFLCALRLARIRDHDAQSLGSSDG